MQGRRFLDAGLVQLLEELAGHEDFDRLSSLLGLDLLLLHDVFHELCEWYLVRAEVVDHAVDEADGSKVEHLVVQVLRVLRALRRLVVYQAKRLQARLQVGVEIVSTEARCLEDLVESQSLGWLRRIVELVLNLHDKVVRHEHLDLLALLAAALFEPAGICEHPCIVVRVQHLTEQVTSRVLQLWIRRLDALSVLVEQCTGELDGYTHFTLTAGMRLGRIKAGQVAVGSCHSHHGLDHTVHEAESLLAGRETVTEAGLEYVPSRHLVSGFALLDLVLVDWRLRRIRRWCSVVLLIVVLVAFVILTSRRGGWLSCVFLFFNLSR